jgi:hypothetical protein
MTSFEIQPYSPYDKRIRVSGPVHFDIDNDDVDTKANELLIHRLVDTLNAYWQPMYRSHCVNEDCEDYWDMWFPITTGYERCYKCDNVRQIFEVGA